MKKPMSALYKLGILASFLAGFAAILLFCLNIVAWSAGDSLPLLSSIARHFGLVLKFSFGLETVFEFLFAVFCFALGIWLVVPEPR